MPVTVLPAKKSCKPLSILLDGNGIYRYIGDMNSTGSTGATMSATTTETTSLNANGPHRTVLARNGQPLRFVSRAQAERKAAQVGGSVVEPGRFSRAFYVAPAGH